MHFFYATDFTTTVLTVTVPHLYFRSVYLLNICLNCISNTSYKIVLEFLNIFNHIYYMVVAVNHCSVEKKREKLSIWKIPFGV